MFPISSRDMPDQEPGIFPFWDVNAFIIVFPNGLPVRPSQGAVFVDI
jgi:hypothetical protein